MAKLHISHKYHYVMARHIEPPHEKTCLRGFQIGHTQTSLISYLDYLENGNFTSSKFRYDTYQYVNNIGADQTARMRRLVCAFVVCKNEDRLHQGPFVFIF